MIRICDITVKSWFGHSGNTLLIKIIFEQCVCGGIAIFEKQGYSPILHLER
jgi:hypothetical protein